jgi:hypothetical protein
LFGGKRGVQTDGACYWIVDNPEIFFFQRFHREQSHFVEIGVQLYLIFGAIDVEKKIEEENVNIVANDASPRARNI